MKITRSQKNYITLFEICKPKQWPTLSSSQFKKEGYPVYGANGIIGYYDQYTHKDPTILIACRGTCGKVNITKPFSYVMGNAMALDNLDVSRVNLKFLVYILEFDGLKDTITGAVQAQITLQSLKNFKFFLPTMEEQKYISTVLDKVSDIIFLHQQQLAKLDELVKSRFVEMFGNETNSLCLPIVKIGEIASISVGVVIRPAQYYTDKESGVRAFRSLNIGEMYIKNNDWVYFSQEGNRKNAKSILQENDIIIVRSGDPGTSCVITKEYAGSNAIDVIIARPNFDKVNPYYLCAFTNLPHGKEQIKLGTGGAAQQHFNVGKYKNMTLALPPIALQNQFAAFVVQTEKTKTAIKQSLRHLETLKQSLMQEFFA